MAATLESAVEYFASYVGMTRPGLRTPQQSYAQPPSCYEESRARGTFGEIWVVQWFPEHVLGGDNAPNNRDPALSKPTNIISTLLNLASIEK